MSISSSTNCEPVNIKDKLLEELAGPSDISPLTSYVPLNIKEEPVELCDNSSSTSCMPLRIKEEPVELCDNSSSTSCMPLRIKEEPVELCDNFSSTSCMPLRIKKELFEMPDSSSSTDCMPVYIKEEVLELSDNSSTNCMPLKIKEEPPELSVSSLSTNCMPLNLKEVPLELSDSSSLTNGMPLNITDEMPDNVFLKIEIEENPESCDSSISPVTASKNDHFYSKNMDVTIDDNIFKRENASEENISKTGGASSCRSFPYTGETNFCEHDLVNNSSTLINPESKNGFIRQMTNETATVPNITDDHNSSYSSLPLIIPLQNVPCSSGSVESTNVVFLTNPQGPSNVLTRPSILHASNDEKHINDMVAKLKVVQRRNAWEVKYSDNVLRGVDDETLKLLVSNPSDRFCSANEQSSYVHAKINDGVRTENVEHLVNQNSLLISKDPMSMINQNIPSISKEKPNIPNDKNFVTKTVVINNGKIWEIRDEKKNVVRGINKVRNDSVDPTLNQNIPPTSIESFIINPNISSILKEKPIINPNNPCIIKGGSSATESSSVQAGKVWEIRDEEHNVMRGINKGTLKHNKNIPSIYKHFEPTTNRNIPSITKEKPIINPNTPRIVSDENSATESSSVQVGKDWEIRDEGQNVMRGINKETLEHNKNILSIYKDPPPTTNRNIPSITKEKPIINPNTPRIVSDENSAAESSSVQAGKVWEIRDEGHNGMRGINKGTLEHNKNILSIYKDPPPTTNRNIPSITKEKPIINPNVPIITKEKPIINPNIPRISSNKNSAIKPTFLKAGKIWEIRDKQRNVIRGINKETLKYYFPKSLGTSSSQNKQPNNESLEKGGNKNAGLLQSTKETENPNKGSRVSSHNVRNLTFLVENLGKTTNITISDEHAESRERGVKTASQFQNMQDKVKSNPRSLLRSPHTAQSSTILTGNVGKSVNERMSPKINKRTAEYGRGALVYDRVSSRPQISTLTKRLQPLYKYIKDNKCLLCGFESKSSDTYGVRRHLACHLPGRNLKCDICDKYFSAAGLPAHKANIHGKSKSKVSCKECNLNFSTKASLVTHRRKHHKPAQTYTCLICNHEFKEAHSLKEHCRIHTGEKPFSCTVCSETFRTRGMLNSHSLRHNNKKLYSCKLCDKSYNNKGLMTEHMNSHKGTSDIKCNICEKTFNYKSNLAQHMFTHSDKRPHKCETCGLKFKLSHHLRSHLATHHA